LMVLGAKFLVPAMVGLSSDPKADLERADEFESKALAVDPDYTWAHDLKGTILRTEQRAAEAVAEHESALAIDSSNVDAAFQLAFDNVVLGRFEKGLKTFESAMVASPHDPGLRYWAAGMAWANFGLKRYDQAIETARRAIAIDPNYNPMAQASLVAALALTDHNAEAREALQRYLALPSTGPLRTIAAWKAYYNSTLPKQGADPSIFEAGERIYDGLRKAGMPEE
jgi:tetratricopeptide (TPR) repeat protein